MIKLEHVVLPSPEQMEFVIEGMRNPMNSWDKSDSYFGYDCTSCGKIERDGHCGIGDPEREHCIDYYGFELGQNDNNLMRRLARAGACERKYLRMMPVMVRITAPLYWWKEFDTYKIATVANSCSTMHKIHDKEFTLEDFSTDKITDICCDDIKLLEDYESDDLLYYKHRVDVEFADYIHELNFMRRLYLAADRKLKRTDLTDSERKHVLNQHKRFWWQMIQLLPSSYNQTRNVMMNYEVLANIYKWRRHHKLDEWREFCKWIETLPYFELIRSTIESDVKVYTPAEYAKEYPESAAKIQKMARGEE